MFNLKNTVKFKKTYHAYETQINNVLAETLEKDKKRETDRIVKDLIFAKEHTKYTGIEYFMLGLYNKPHSEWYDILPDSSANIICRRMNDLSSGIKVANKYEVYLKFKDFYKREMICIKSAQDKDIFQQFLKKYHAIMTKPVCGSLGDDCLIIKDDDIDNIDSLFNTLLKTYDGEFVAEELLVQIDEMAKFNPTSVNTLRITTVRMDDRVDAEAFLRVGKMFSKVDNIAKNGIVCTLDQDSGVITSAMDKAACSYTHHPHTRMQLVGSVVPQFKDAIELSKKLAQVMPQYRYIGWDLALTEKGWVLIELNARAGIYCIQQSMGRGIRKDFEQYFKEIGQPTDFPDQFDKVFLKEIGK